MAFFLHANPLQAYDMPNLYNTQHSQGHLKLLKPSSKIRLYINLLSVVFL